MSVIGFLNHGSADGSADRLRAFRQGLAETGCRGPQRGDRISLGK
jgi:hypothetical protein